MDNVIGTIFVTFLGATSLVLLFVVLKTGRTFCIGPSLVSVTRKSNPVSFWSVVALLAAMVFLIVPLLVNSFLMSASMAPISITEVGSEVILFFFGWLFN